MLSPGDFKRNLGRNTKIFALGLNCYKGERKRIGPVPLGVSGTGGLLAPDKNPGSYLFLTCADPDTRRGIVAGWITEDRGSGVVVSCSLLLLRNLLQSRSHLRRRSFSRYAIILARRVRGASATISVDTRVA